MIALEGARARAGRFELQGVSFRVEQGEWAVLLGAAGSGKTTLLEVIAGIRPVQSGRVSLRGADVTGMPPESRRVGMVYQHAFLFPHLSALDNVSYAGSTDAASTAIALLGIEPFMQRSVDSLSGGERQLVALARALATEPDILLLDEPFAALDPRRRVRVRTELRRLVRERGMTVLHVTHDFVEAGVLGDVGLVLEAGVLVQAGRPEDLFRKPTSASVAEFVGAENVFAGVVSAPGESAGDELVPLEFTGEGIVLHGIGQRMEGPGHAVIRAQDVTLGVAQGTTSARNVLRGTVHEVAVDGVLAHVSVRVGETVVAALVTRASAQELALRPGSDVAATIKATNVHLC